MKPCCLCSKPIVKGDDMFLELENGKRFHWDCLKMVNDQLKQHTPYRIVSGPHHVCRELNRFCKRCQEEGLNTTGRLGAAPELATPAPKPVARGRRRG